MRRALLAIAAAAAIGVLIAPAGASALGPNAIRSGFDANVYGANDDGTYPCTGPDPGPPIGCTPAPLALPFPIDYFGTTYSATFLNNNGNLTFDAPLSTFTPFNLVTTTRAIIAPFFADVDTRIGNTVTYGSGTVDGHPAFGVNWPGVGCYEANISVLNYFQLILVDRSDVAAGDFDMEFNYDQIQWDAGQASNGDASCRNGDAARVGFSNGSTQSFELAGSGVDDGFLDTNVTTGLINNSLNTSQLGRYIFRVRAGEPNSPPVIGAPATVNGVYSDAITPVTVTATDANAGDTVTLSATGLPAGLTFTDNGDRTGTISGTPTVAAGTYTATITASDGVNADQTQDVDVVVAKEDCTLTTPPVILSSASGPTTLTATLGESDATPGDLSGKTISFSLTDSAANPWGPYTGTTDATGVASASASLPPDAYTMDAGFAGDGFYNPCSAAGDTIVTVSPAGAKATGGGWYTTAGGRSSVGFNAIRDVTGLHGQLQLRSNKDRFHAHGIDSLSGSGNTAAWSGTGSWNGTPGYRFTVTVVDNGSSGARKGDTINLVIRKPAPDNTVVYSTGGAVTLKGGNFTVH